MCSALVASDNFSYTNIYDDDDNTLLQNAPRVYHTIMGYFCLRNQDDILWVLFNFPYRRKSAKCIKI